MAGRIAVLGAGAFGTALALTLAGAGRAVTLWARDPGGLRPTRESPRLPGFALPEAIGLTGDLVAATAADVVLLALPMQALAGFLAQHGRLLAGKWLVGCAKGLDLTTGQGSAEVIAAAVPDARVAILSGPGFAGDLARGLPTAMVLASRDASAGPIQGLLSGPALRVYLSQDVTGVTLGGALKNVIAIAAGISIGAGLGESARAALMTRGYAEMVRFAVARGAKAQTLAGLSGLGDLVLTATSTQSRNFRHGQAMGAAGRLVPAEGTLEGVATARALARIARNEGLDMPITLALDDILAGTADVATAMSELLSRSLKSE